MSHASLPPSRRARRGLTPALLFSATVSIVWSAPREAAAQFISGWGEVSPLASEVWPSLTPSTTENTIVAIPPDRTGCGSDGGVIIARGDKANGALVSANTLRCASSSPACITMTSDLRTAHGIPPGVEDHFEETSHNDIARLNDGTVLIARSLVRYSPAAPSNRRGMVAFFSSNDCGGSWQEASQLDPASIPGTDDFGQGILYADPWSSRVYYVVRNNPTPTFVFVSTDGGYSWSDPFPIGASDSGYRVTSMPSGTTYFLGTFQTTTELYQYEPGGEPSFLDFGVRDVATGLGQIGDIGISRVGQLPDGDYLRIVYPVRLSPSNQVALRYEVVQVANGSAFSMRSSNITGTGHIVGATFVDTDRFELPTAAVENGALLYWQEQSCVGGGPGYQMNGKLVRDLDNWTAPLVIDSKSTDCGGFGANPPVNPQGDFGRGAFVYDPSLRTLDFLAHWTDLSPTSGSTPGSAVRFIEFPRRDNNYGPVETFGAWGSLGTSPSGAFVGTPAVASWGPMHLEVFGTAADRSVWHRSCDNGACAPGWDQVIPGTVALGGPAVVSPQPGQVDAVVIGSENGLWYAHLEGGSWQGWTPLGRPPGNAALGFEPAIASSPNGRLDVFASTVATTYHRSCSGSCLAAASWSAWEDLGQPPGGIWGGPAAVGASSGRLDVVQVTRADMTMARKSFDPSTGLWSGWSSLGGVFAGGARPGLASWAPGHLDVFARGFDNIVYHRSIDPSAHPLAFWLSSTSWAGDTGVGATSPGPNRVDQVVLGRDGAIWLAQAPYRIVNPIATTQSSTAYGGTADRAADGNADGNYFDGSVTHTDFEFQPWWQADLGATTDIAFVDVYNRADCCADRLTNFNVAVSPDGATWQTVDVAGQGGAPTGVTFNAPGRFVRVQLAGTNYLSLAEVSIWTR